MFSGHPSAVRLAVFPLTPILHVRYLYLVEGFQ